MGFKVGDTVVCVNRQDNAYLTEGRVYRVERIGVCMQKEYISVTDDAGYLNAYHSYRFRAAGEVVPARSNDPATSKVAAKKVRKASIKSVILDLLERYPSGLTGQEIAERTGYRLNSVTPRFAELARPSMDAGGEYEPEGKIKDSGLRRSGQIVWVLT